MQKQTKIYAKEFFLTLGVAALVVIGYILGVEEANRQKLMDYYYNACERMGQKTIKIGQHDKQKALVA